MEKVDTQTEKKWPEQSTREQTIKFIEYVDKNYHKDYDKESQKYQFRNFISHMAIIVIGFLVTIIIGLKHMDVFDNPDTIKMMEVVSFILPSVSSVILLYISQRGFKKKEEIRENARNKCKYLVNEARIRFSKCVSQDDFFGLYQWLNKEIEKLQTTQSDDYFGAQGKMNT